MLDVSAVLEEIKASPYEEVVVSAPHSGEISFPEGLKSGDAVAGPSGNWKEKPGALLATISRERNPQPILCPERGEIVSVHRELHGTFVQAGTELVRLRHFLSREEVVRLILKRALHLFRAPERAKYYFIPSVDKKVKASGARSVTVKPGMELFIVSRMKREKPLVYEGPEGIIYAVYFQHDQNVDQGAPLVGVCPADQTDLIQDVVNRVRTDWEEKE